MNTEQIPKQLNQEQFIFWKQLESGKAPVNLEGRAVHLPNAPTFSLDEISKSPLLAAYPIGLNLTNSDLVRFDIDFKGGATLEDMACHEEGAEILNRLKNLGYFYRTPSGNLAVLVNGGRVQNCLKRNFDLGDGKAFTVEVFSSSHHTKWVTISDDSDIIINGVEYGTKDLKPQPFEVKALISKFFVNNDESYAIPVDPENYTNLSNDVVLNVIFGGKDGNKYRACFDGKHVFAARDGDTSESTQHTFLLARLAWATGGNVDQIVDIFNQSAWVNAEDYRDKKRANRIWRRAAKIASNQAARGFCSLKGETNGAQTNRNDSPKAPHPIFNNALNWHQDVVNKVLLTKLEAFEGCNVVNIPVNQLSIDSETGKPKYLRADLIPQETKVTGVAGSMGMGKTQSLKPIINAAASCVVISHRILLAQNHAEDFNIWYYQDAKKKDKIPLKVSTTIHSLNAVASNDSPPELLILDEVVSILAALASAVDKKDKVVENLKNLIQSAKHVILLDAFLSEAVIQFIDFCGIDRKSVTIYKVKENVSFPDVSVYWHDSKATALQVVESRLNDDKQTVLFCNSKRQAEIAHERLQGKYPDKAFLLITSDTSFYEAQQLFAKEPNKYGQLYDLIITSPSIDAGTSITLSEFDTVVALFSVQQTGTGDALGAIQQLGRCRKSTRWHVWCDHKEFNLPTNSDDILKGKISLLQLEQAMLSKGIDRHMSLTFEQIINMCSDDPLASLTSNLEAFNNLQVNRFAMSLYALLHTKMGLPITLVEENETLTAILKEETEEAKDAIILKRLKLLRQQATLSEEEYSEYHKNIQWALENRLRIQRFRFENDYGVNIEEDITPYKNTPMLELLKMHIDDKLLSRIKSAETVAFTDHGDIARQYAQQQVIGGATAVKDETGKTKYIEKDAAHVTEQSHDLLLQHTVRKLALEAVGIDPQTLNVANPHYFNADTIKQTPFYQFCVDNAQAINASSRIPVHVTSNFVEKPLQALRGLLDQLGFEVNRKKIKKLHIDPPYAHTYKYTGDRVGQGGENMSENVGNKAESNDNEKRIHAYIVVADAYNLIQDIVLDRFNRSVHWLQQWASRNITLSDYEKYGERLKKLTAYVPKAYYEVQAILDYKWFVLSTEQLSDGVQHYLAQLHNRLYANEIEKGVGEEAARQSANDDIDRVLTDEKMLSMVKEHVAQEQRYYSQGADEGVGA